MGDVLGSVWWLVVSLGLLVTFHEFGHYWVARRCGVDVLRFSVGFGKPLWSRTNRAGTEFAIAAIPLGGYVKMLDERGPTSRSNARRTRSTARACGSGSPLSRQARPPTCCCAWPCFG
jgi:RIP metalloprotease RseP